MSQINLNFNTDTKKTSEVFIANQESNFSIPIYQRYYSWDNNNCLKLFNDLCDIVDQHKKDHFIGTLFLIKYQDSNIYDIVDGQQRLTTISLLLKSIYDEVEMVMPSGDIQCLKFLDKIKDSFLIHNNDLFSIGINADIEGKLRLKLTDKDSAVYTKLMSSLLDSEMHKELSKNKVHDIVLPSYIDQDILESKLINNYCYFRALIRKTWQLKQNQDPNQSLKDIEIPNLIGSSPDIIKQYIHFCYRIFDAVSEHLEFLHIVVESQSDNQANTINALELFENLNATGKDLEPHDLIRNYIFMHLDEEQQYELYSKYWSKLEQYERYDSNFIKQFFFRYVSMLICRDYKTLPKLKNHISSTEYVRREDVFICFKFYTEAKKDYRTKSGKTWTEEDMLKDIFHNACLYAISNGINEPELQRAYPLDNKIQKLFNLYTYNPLSLYIINKTYNKDDNSELYKILKLLENQFIRCLLSYQFDSEGENENNIQSPKNFSDPFNNKKILNYIRYFEEQISKGQPSLYTVIYNSVKEASVDNSNDAPQKLVRFYIPSDEELRAGIKSLNNSRLLCKYDYILRTIAENDENNPEQNILPDNICYTHIKPPIKSEIDDEFLGNNIGNIILVTKAASTELKKITTSFRDRKEFFSDTYIPDCDHAVLDATEWTNEQIIERSNKLAEKIIKLWPRLPNFNNN